MNAIPFQAVTFDVGGTLIEPYPSVGHVYAEVAVRHGHGNLSPTLLNQRFEEAWRGRKKFGYTLTAWSQLIEQTFAGLTEKETTAAFFSEVYRAFESPSAWRVFPDVLPALNELHQLDLKLGVISNWDERLRPLLERLQLAEHFQVVIVSIELGAHKPEPEIFREASKRLGLPPRSILHIGDSELEDYQGAKRAGFDALRIDRRGPSDSQRFSSLAQMGERCQALRN